MRLGALLVAGFQVACLEAPPGSGGAPPDGGPSADAAPLCARFGDWSPEAIAVMPGVVAWGPTVTQDQALLVYEPGDGTLGIADRDGDQFVPGDVSLLSLVDTSAEERNPSLSLDGLTLWFSRGPLDEGALYVSHRGSRSEGFPMAQPIGGFTALAPEAPDVWDSGQQIFFSLLGPDDQHDLAYAACTDLTDCEVVGAIDVGDENDDGYPTLRSDGLEMVYDNEVIGLSRAARDSTALPFEDVELLELSGGDPELSWDGATLYFSNGEIQQTTRSCLDE